MRMVVEGLEDNHLPRLPDARVDEVLTWFRSVKTTEAQEIGYSAEATAGAGVDTSSPWFSFVKLLFNLTGQLKATGSRCKEIARTQALAAESGISQ